MNNNKLLLVAALCYLSGFGRELLRVLLAASGDMEWQANWAIQWSFMPPIVNLWDLTGIPIFGALTWFYWRMIEWKP